MSKAEDSELLEILITGHEAESPQKGEEDADYKHLLSTFGSESVRSSASASRPSAKKGILKRGVALRRASSFSIGQKSLTVSSCMHWASSMSGHKSLVS